MKIILTQTGGLMGRTQIASAEWKGTIKQFEELADQLKIKGKNKSADSYAYTIRLSNKRKNIPISISDIPNEYEKLFDELFQNLKFIKD